MSRTFQRTVATVAASLFVAGSTAAFAAGPADPRPLPRNPSAAARPLPKGEKPAVIKASADDAPPALAIPNIESEEQTPVKATHGKGSDPFADRASSNLVNRSSAKGSDPVADDETLVPEPTAAVSLLQDGVPPAPGGSNEYDPGTTEPDDVFASPETIGCIPYFPHLGGNYAVCLPHAQPVFHDECIPEEHEPAYWRIKEHFIGCLEKPHEPLVHLFECILHEEHVVTALDVNPCPIGIQPLPPRPSLVIEWNERFLSPGWLKQGCCTPTGEVVRPAFWVWGEYRTHIAYRENRVGNPDQFTEWANRLDLFGQLNLTGTERLMIGLRPLDEQDGVFQQWREFTTYDFKENKWIDGWNTDVQTLFFEGDFGEIFPFISPYDFEATDYGFSVGRQPLLLQQGLLINEDRMDMVTVTRNTLNGGGNLNLRITGAWAFNEINRHGLTAPAAFNFEEEDTQLFGLFTESDFAWSTVNLDAAFLDSNEFGDDLFAVGLSFTQRMKGYHNTYNSFLSALASVATDGETPAAGDGQLLFGQLAWTPHHTEDVIYVNGFWANDQFTSPARGPLMGGPMGQVGLLFAHVELGRYGPVLNNQTNEAAGASLGYQMFFDHTRQNVTVEIGGRSGTPRRTGNNGMIGLVTNYQRAMGQHWIWVLEGFVGKTEEIDMTSGVRTEILYRF